MCMPHGPQVGVSHTGQGVVSVVLYVVGNYTLPLDHSVLVLSDRCQLGYHGESWAYVTAADITCSGGAL